MLLLLLPASLPTAHSFPQPSFRKELKFLSSSLKTSIESAEEVAFELEAGKTYQLSGAVDFNLTPVTLRGDKYNRPIVVISGKEGYITTQAGLKLKNINFDMSAAEAQSFITLSGTPSESITTEALGFKELGANQNSYVIMGQVSVESMQLPQHAGQLYLGQQATLIA